MSEDQKIIKHEGVKYYKKEGQWHRLVPVEDDKVPVAKKSKKGQYYRLVPIGEDKVPADIKTKKSKLNLQPEILLDIFKFLNFVQLLAVQQTNFYFKNFIDTHEKLLARKKYERLEFIIPDQLYFDVDRYEDYKPYPKLYYLELVENGFYESECGFIKLDPQLYDFKLSEQLKEKWKAGIENSIPMFLTGDDVNKRRRPINTIFCELLHDYKVDKGYLLFEVMEYVIMSHFF
ncbi:unnamed protein product [Meloidogyne enterolobii]|uniref:Uncharacterized protein n=1 Tax=Meloidogyne enterolobii TaxID=390850 RepID=A0ACB1B198_MELEN